MLTFREFQLICEKKSNIPPHAVPGSYTEHPDGTKRYTLAPYKGPSGPATKSEIKNVVLKHSGGKAVEKSLPKNVAKDLKKVAKKAKKKEAKKITKIEEQIPPMKPNLYSQQVAMRQAAQKTAQIKHVHQELGAEARTQQAAKYRRLKAIMSR